MDESELPDSGTGGGAPEATPGSQAEAPAVAKPPVRTSTLETHVASEVQAGQTFSPTCLLVDEQGDAELLPPDQYEIRFSPERAAAGGPDGSVLAQEATTLLVWCEAKGLALIDESPAIVRVLPGVPAFVETLVSTHGLRAGEKFDVGCRAYDAFYNPVPVTPSVRVLPSDSGFSEEGNWTFTRAGVYQVGCEAPGAEPDVVSVEVRPGDPIALTIARVPDERVYAPFAVVQIAAHATDAYGNQVPSARVALQSSPSALAVGETRLRFDQEGKFTIVASLISAPSVKASTEVTVNGVGPSITCGVGSTGLRDGSMARLPTNKSLTFTGSATDANGVASLSVNGTAVTPDSTGKFSAPVTGRFGMNFVDVKAVDKFGAESTRVCSFLASQRFDDPQTLLAGAVTLSLGQAALDDGNPSGPLNSLNDLLSTAINSPALRTELHKALLAENPVKPRSCDQKVLGLCVFTTEIIYLDSELRGPNSTQLTLIPNGVHARVVLNDVRLKLRVNGTLSSTGWAKFGRITIDADFDARLLNGRPSIHVRADNVTVAVEGIDTDFSGVSGFFLDIVLSIAKGKLGDAVRNLVHDWVRDNFNQILDGVLGGLDVSSLGSNLKIKSLDGSRDVAVTFGLGFSSLDVTPARMRFGIATRFTGVPTLGLDSLGVAVPEGAVLRERDGTTKAELAVQVAVLNQALHALWRGGLFEGDVASALNTGGAVEGLKIIVSAKLPPVAQLRADGLTELGLGALRLSLIYPGISDVPITLSLGARATLRAALVGDRLQFSDLKVEQLVFSADSTLLDSESRAALQNVLLSLVQSLVGKALNDAIPALPLPSFALPSELTRFGLPAGARLGLQDRTLDVRPPHYVLRTGFGIGGNP